MRASLPHLCDRGGRWFRRIKSVYVRYIGSRDPVSHRRARSHSATSEVRSACCCTLRAHAATVNGRCMRVSTHEGSDRSAWTTGREQTGHEPRDASRKPCQWHLEPSRLQRFSGSVGASKRGMPAAVGGASFSSIAYCSRYHRPRPAKPLLSLIAHHGHLGSARRQTFGARYTRWRDCSIFAPPTSLARTAQ